MAGRPKMAMYEYNQDLKFVGKYASKTEVFNKYYEGKKRPLLNSGEDYLVLPNGNYLCNRPIGRDKLYSIFRAKDSKFVVTHGKEIRKPVSAYNLLGEKVATFRSAHMASLITGIDRSTIARSAEVNTGKSKSRTKSLELIFKYEDNSVSLHKENNVIHE